MNHIMLYIDAESGLNRKTYENDDLVKIKINKSQEPDNWGDEDCIKMVSVVTDCEITINPSIADDFQDVNSISFYRKDYYEPAYYIHAKNQTKTINDDGSITYIAR